MANDFTGRILRITNAGQIPLANLKVEGGIWTGGTAGDVFSIVDAAGRQYDWTFPADGSAVVITKLGWLSGPVTILTIPHGEVQFYLGTR